MYKYTDILLKAYSQMASVDANIFTFAGMGNIRQQVALCDARFFAYHGYYAEEQVSGNEFTVDIRVEFNRSEALTTEQLQQTVNYEKLYEIAKSEMEKPRKLLESVVETLLHRVRTEFPFLSTITVGITKHNPPFGGDRSNAYVELRWTASC